MATTTTTTTTTTILPKPKQLKLHGFSPRGDPYDLYVCLGVDEEGPQTLSLRSVARHEVGFGVGHDLKTLVPVYWNDARVSKWIVTDYSTGAFVAKLTYDGSEAKLSLEI